MTSAEHLHNQIDGPVSGSVVQARDIGEIHFHGSASGMRRYLGWIGPRHGQAGR
jgi:hypothetical protein